MQDVKTNQTAVKILIPSVLILVGLWLLHFVIEIRYIWMRGSRQDAPREFGFGAPSSILLTGREWLSPHSMIGSAMLPIDVVPDIVVRGGE